jgi:hypothetical protein
MTKMHAWVTGILAVAGVSAVVLAQGGKPPVIATDITAAEVEAVVKHPTGGTDRLMKAVDMGGYNVGVGVLRRGPTKPGAPVGAIMHEKITEVYYVVSGSGTADRRHGLEPDAGGGRWRDRQVAVGPSVQGTFRSPRSCKVSLRHRDHSARRVSRVRRGDGPRRYVMLTQTRASRQLVHPR